MSSDLLLSEVLPTPFLRARHRVSRVMTATRKEAIMARSKTRDTGGGTVDKIVGRLKEAGGALSGNERRKAKGQFRQAKGSAKQKKGRLRKRVK
jgi:uncharacterized protein YjbJ (UPF0337 family)